MGAKKMMEIVDPPVSYSTKPNSNLYILCEGFKYTLREWRSWTHDIIEIDDYDAGDYESGIIKITRGEYSMAFVSEIIAILHDNGYVLKHSVDSIVRRFMHYWMQLYKTNGWDTTLPAVDGSKKSVDLEEWEGLFSVKFWENITIPYIAHYGFDDTRVGQELLANIGYFFWTYVDGKNSDKIIAKRRDEAEIEKEMRKWREDIDGGKGALMASKDDTAEDVKEKDDFDNQRDKNGFN